MDQIKPPKNRQIAIIFSQTKLNHRNFTTLEKEKKRQTHMWTLQFHDWKKKSWKCDGIVLLTRSMLRFDDFLRFLFLSLNYYHHISWLPPNELSWVTGSLGPPAQQKTKQIFDFWKIREKLNLTGKYCIFVNKIQN